MWGPQAKGIKKKMEKKIGMTLLTCQRWKKEKENQKKRKKQKKERKGFVPGVEFIYGETHGTQTQTKKNAKQKANSEKNSRKILEKIRRFCIVIWGFSS